MLVDLSGPKIRTRTAAKHDARFSGKRRGIRHHFAAISKATQQEVSTNFKELPKLVEKDARILLDDGAIELKVEKVTKTDVTTNVINGGVLASAKESICRIRNCRFRALTDKDRVDLEWAMTQDIDYIALSFVRRAKIVWKSKN